MRPRPELLEQPHALARGPVTRHAHRDTAHTCSQAAPCCPERVGPLSGTAGSGRPAREQGWGLDEVLLPQPCLGSHTRCQPGWSPVASLAGRWPPAMSSRGQPSLCGSPGVSGNKAGRVGPGPTLTTSSDLSHLQVQPPWGSGLLCGPGDTSLSHLRAQTRLQPHCWPLPAPPAEDSSPGAGIPPVALAEGGPDRGLSPGCASAPGVLWAPCVRVRPGILGGLVCGWVQTRRRGPTCPGGVGDWGPLAGSARGGRAEPEVVEGCPQSPLRLLPRPSPSLYSHILQGKHTLLPSCRGKDVCGRSAAPGTSVRPPAPGACAGHRGQAQLPWEHLPSGQEVLPRLPAR